MITDDARERFLREIVEHVPADRIAELHLFRPLRRGPTETGVAVIAVEHERVAEPMVADVPFDESESVADREENGSAEPDHDRDSEVREHGGEDMSGRAAMGALITSDPTVTDDLTLAADDGAARDEDAGEVPVYDSSPYADDPTDAPACAADVSLASSRPAPPVRHTVFTARYRLTRKGADRGKWEFEVVADADAPLGTVDTVVRCVQRRAGDDEEPERLTAEGVRAALDGQAWRQTT